MVIRHVTILRFKPGGIPEADRKVWLQGVNSFMSRIPGILAFSHGQDLNLTIGQPNGDYSIVADFESAEVLQAYYTHPFHDEVKAISFANAEQVVTVDFEVGPTRDS
jgi:hypothetical protein